MASQNEDNSIQEALLVDPTGQCFLVNRFSGEVCWSGAVETNSQPPRMLHLGQDRMEVRIVEGDIILRHWNAATEKWTRLQLVPGRITRFLERYAVDFTFNLPVETPYDVDYSTGLPSRDVSNVFQIKKFDYKITGPTWTLEFSRYEASFPPSEPWMVDADRVPCRVYHSFDMRGFLTACRLLYVTVFPNGETTQDLTSFESLNDNKILRNPQEVLGVGPRSTVYRGTILGLNVAVKEIQRISSFSEMYNNLWLANACDNIVRFYGAELHESSCLLAFEECQRTLFDYVHTRHFRDSLLYTSWSTVMSGIVIGLHHLHRLEMAHGNLNPHNILLTEDYVPRISGMSNSHSLNPESQAWDLHCLGAVLLYCFTIGGYNFNDTDPDPNYDYDVHVNGFEDVEKVEFIEVFDVIRMLLYNENEHRLLLKVYQHPWLWDCTKRLQFLREVSDTLESLIKSPGFKFLTKELETIKGKVIPQDNQRKRNWKACFTDELVNHMESNRYGNKKYKEHSVYHLLRFIRNYMQHIGSIEDDELLYLGVDDDALEPNLRGIFPPLLIEVYKVMKPLVGYLPPSSRVPGYYYM